MLFFLLIMGPSEADAFDPILTDPDVPNGEQTVWRATRSDEDPEFSTFTWSAGDFDGNPAYEITMDSGERKQARYVIDRGDLRLIYSHILRNTEKGRSEVTVEVKGGYQYLVHDLMGKRYGKRIEHHPDGYNGMILAFSLRGFPFGRQKEVELRATPPFKPKTPLWMWKMWKTYARLLGEERVTVPAGSFNCYKLEVAASGGLVKRITSQYHFWFTKEPPHRFVKYQDKDGKTVTELLEIRSKGEK